MGVDVVGGIPHFERTMEEGHESIRILCEIAEKRGLLTDCIVMKQMTQCQGMLRNLHWKLLDLALTDV